MTAPKDAFPWREGVVPVEVDGELLVLDSASGRVVRLSGPAKAAVEGRRSVRPAGLPSDTPGVVDVLAGLGLTQERVSDADRRGVLRAGALAALGVSVLALPSAAAHATGGSGGGDGLFASGTGDETFTAAGAPNNYVMAIQSQPNGKIYIGGGFTQVGGVNYGRLARLNADGTLDNTFANPALPGDVLDLDVDANGAVVVGGVNSFAARRYLVDGTLDTSFTVSNVWHGITSTQGLFESVAVRPDGKVYVGGQFTDIGGTTRSGLARLNVDGSLDTTFNAGLNLNLAANQAGFTYSVKTWGNTVVAGGTFTSTASGTFTRLARFLDDGSVDPTFSVDPIVNGQIRKVSVDGAGGALIAGEFSSVGGRPRSKVARVQPNGAVDENFAPNAVSGGQNDVRAILVQGDGRVIIGGRFTSPRAYIARLEPNGAVESDFDLLANNNVWSLALDSSGRLLVGGQFTSIGGISRSYLARIG